MSADGSNSRLWQSGAIFKNGVSCQLKDFADHCQCMAFHSSLRCAIITERLCLPSAVVGLR